MSPTVAARVLPRPSGTGRVVARRRRRAPRRVRFAMEVTGAQSVDELSGHVANWLRSHGFPVRDFRIEPLLGGRPGAETTPGIIDYGTDTPGVLDVARRYGRRGSLNDDQVWALRTVIHELLHQMRYGRTPEVYSGDVAQQWEEGATDAVTQDVLPIVARQLFGYAMSPWAVPESTYQPYVDAVRAWSRAATRSPVNSHAARAWRRAFLHADMPERLRMADAAEAAAAARLASR